MGIKMNDWSTRLGEAASSSRQADVSDANLAARWWWRQSDQDCGPFSSLEACLKHARAHAQREHGVSIGYRPSGRYLHTRQRWNRVLEWVDYHLDAQNRMVPSLPESRALPRVLLPFAQR